MSGRTRREVLIWGVAAAGAAAVGAGITLAMGGREDRIAAPPLTPATTAPPAWREAGGWEMKLAKPHGLARDGELLAVAGAGEVAWWSRDGVERRRLAIAGQGLALGADADGLWLARSGAVERLGTTVTPAFALPEGVLPGGIVRAGEHLWLTDCAKRQVLRFAPDGTPGPGLTGCDSFIIPSPWFPLAASSDGQVWVSNTGRHRVEAYDAAGRRGRMWGRMGQDEAGFCGCCNPAWIHVLPDGSFLTAEKGLPRVKLFAADGAFLETVAAPASFHQDCIGLAAVPDGSGGIAVMDPQAGRIRIFRRGA